MGITKFMHDKSEEVLTGEYYPHYPLYPTEHAEKFNYAIRDERDSTYSTILDGLKGTLKLLTIETEDSIKFVDNAFIRTQDGDLWQISGVLFVQSTDHNKQALRWRVRTTQPKSIIRLMGVNEPAPKYKYGNNNDESEV